MTILRRTLSSGIFLCGLAANAQMDMGSQQQNIAGNQSIMAAILQPVAGAPYQAQKLNRSKQTLSDGTIITHESKGLIARDAEGRMREDIYIVHSGQVNGRQTDMNLQSATVGDPVAHTMLIWTGEQAKVAMQMDLPSLPKGTMGGVVGMASPPPGPPTANSPVWSLRKDTPPPGGTTRDAITAPKSVNLANATWPKDEVHTEQLGQQSIEGILVTGKRTTTTIPLGKIGNDRPIVVIHEEWRSPELKILVKTIDIDPRTGEQTMELQGLTRTDPDAALFQAPPGYKVQDMAQMLKTLGEIGKPKPPQ